MIDSKISRNERFHTVWEAYIRANYDNGVAYWHKITDYPRSASYSFKTKWEAQRAIDETIRHLI